MIIEENNIILPKHNLGIIISDIDEKLIDRDIIWKQGILHAYDMDKIRKYDIMLHVVNKHSVLIKPLKPYHCYVFEHIFDFGVWCDGFSQEKIINIYTKNPNLNN